MYRDETIQPIYKNTYIHKGTYFFNERLSATAECIQSRRTQLVVPKIPKRGMKTRT